MGIGVAFYGLANAFHANARLCIFKRIAVGRSIRIPIGAGRRAVYLASAFVGEMVSGNASGDDAGAFLANAGRCEVCRIAIHALRAAVVILVDAGIVQKAFVASA